MNYKKVIIFFLAIIVLILSILILGYEKPRIVIYNKIDKTHDSIKSPYDLTILVNDIVVFTDSLRASPLPLASIDIEFELGINTIVAYSNKANLVDEWVGYYSWDNRFEVEFHTTRYENVEVTRLQILDY